jgi:hypothetical protein
MQKDTKLSAPTVRPILLGSRTRVSLIDRAIWTEGWNLRPLKRKPITTVVPVTAKEAAPDSGADVVFRGTTSFE